MPVVEVVRLRPASGITEEQFLAANDRFEQDYMAKQPGFLRRTLLRGEGHEWAVLVDWGTAARAGIDERVLERSGLGSFQCSLGPGDVPPENRYRSKL
jgi:hypothetical protein